MVYELERVCDGFLCSMSATYDGSSSGSSGSGSGSGSSSSSSSSDSSILCRTNRQGSDLFIIVALSVLMASTYM